MSGHAKWSEIRNKMMDRHGAAEALDKARTEFDEEGRRIPVHLGKEAS